VEGICNLTLQFLLIMYDLPSKNNDIPEPAIVCDGVTMHLGRHPILRDVHFAIPGGTLASLEGENGAGKTTLLKILSTLFIPESGDVRINGFSVIQSPERVRSQIGFVPSDERSFYWRLTGRQNLCFFAALQGCYGRSARDRINELLKAAGLESQADLSFDRYSTGMKQLLGIIRAMLHNPSVLLMDEPTRSLSPQHVEQIHDLFREFTSFQGRTILMVSHSPEELSRLSDMRMVLENGQITTR
jgi:ABC-2 type transport system ATP-binding protein